MHQYQYAICCGQGFHAQPGDFSASSERNLEAKNFLYAVCQRWHSVFRLYAAGQESG